MAKKRKVQKAVVVGKKGNGKTYSMEYAIKNKVNLPQPTKNKKSNSDRLSINVTNINKFLNGITDAEFIYLHKTIGMAVSMRNLIKDYGVSKERFCKDMSIKKRHLDSYLKGSRNYDLKDMAKLNALAYALYMENAEKNAEESTPIKIVRPKAQKFQNNK